LERSSLSPLRAFAQASNALRRNFQSLTFVTPWSEVLITAPSPLSSCSQKKIQLAHFREDQPLVVRTVNSDESQSVLPYPPNHPIVPPYANADRQAMFPFCRRAAEILVADSLAQDDESRQTQFLSPDPALF
jgi:hypothetical protein